MVGIYIYTYNYIKYTLTFTKGWTTTPSPVHVQPCTAQVGPTVPTSRDPLEMFSYFLFLSYVFTCCLSCGVLCCLICYMLFVLCCAVLCYMLYGVCLVLCCVVLYVIWCLSCVVMCCVVLYVIWCLSCVVLCCVVLYVIWCLSCVLSYMLYGVRLVLCCVSYVICDRVRENQPYVGEIDFEIRGPTANSG